MNDTAVAGRKAPVSGEARRNAFAGEGRVMPEINNRSGLQRRRPEAR